MNVWGTPKINALLSRDAYVLEITAPMNVRKKRKANNVVTVVKNTLHSIKGVALGQS